MTVPQRVLVAPSGFKESLSADAVAAAIGTGVQRALPSVGIDIAPLVDGGEGSARALAAATRGEVVPVRVAGPLGEPVESHIGVLSGESEGTVVVEMAAAAGLSLVPRDHRDPAATTTYGVGQLIGAALDHRPKRILVGCGDSGTCDGGAGALQALGARILDRHGRQLPVGGAALADAVRLDSTGLDQRLDDVEILVAVNPHNVLTGPCGVARVFGPQKGATAAQIEHLDEALGVWADVLGRDGRSASDLRRCPGGGASGGLGAGLAGGLGARLLPRFEVMFDHVDLDKLIADADLVITAEGAIDFQTPNGKIPAEVARRAKRHGKPVLALAGSVGEGAGDVHAIGIDSYASILNVPMPLSDAVERGYELVADASEQLMRTMLVGCGMARQKPQSGGLQKPAMLAV